MGKAVERKKQILNILNSRKLIFLNDLVTELGVSSMTVRRHLKILENSGAVTVHNGVVLLNEDPDIADDKHYSLHNASTRNIDKKRAIGNRAVKLINEHDVIIIDTGSTCEFIAKAIPKDLDITTICYTLNTFMEIYNKQSRIIFGGGFFHKNSMMFESSESIQLISNNRASMAFISASGVTIDLGVTCENYYEQKVKIAAINSSLKKVLVADSTKFGKVRVAHFAEITDFDIIITNDDLDPEFIDYFKENNISVILAKKAFTR